MHSIYDVGLPVVLILTYQAGIVADWTAWSACSKPCDVGIQSRTRLYDGQNRTEEQYCNLQYCPDKGVSCFGGRLSCTQFSGYADCLDGVCVCTLGRNNYSKYYNTQNCFPEVGNCIIRENPPFALAIVETLDYGYKLRSCVTNDNPNYEVHVIGVYERNSYNVIIRPRGGTDKPIILVLLSYHIVTWNIDTSVPIDSIVYSILRNDSYQPVVVLEKSKCGSAKIIRFNDLRYTTGSDTGGGNTPKILLTLANFYGPVTSFNGVYTLFSPATIRLEVGGNPLLLNTNAEFKDHVWSCNKVSPQYSNMTFTGTVVPPEVTTANNMFSNNSDWTPWSACSKPCDVGIQSRTRLYDGENRTEEQYCNLQYCPDKGVSCYGGRFSCTQFSGYADCIDGQCVCTLGRAYYGSTTYYREYYNSQNCFPEVGNCIIRENPPFALAKVETLNFGYKLRSCITNDNPNYEVHVIGVYERNSYDVIIRPRGGTDKPIILVLLSYHIVTWNIDTSVPIDSIVYSILRSDTYQPVEIIEKSKCGSAKIIRFDDLRYTTGSDTGGGNTPKILLTLANFYGPVTSFNGVYTLYSPATIRLEVGGNPLLLKTNTEFKDYDWSCRKVSPQYSNMTFTGTVVPPVRPEVTTADNMFTSSSSSAVILPTVIACAVVVTVICIIVVIARKRKRANLRYIECAAPQRIIRGALLSYAAPPASYSGPPSDSVPLDGWSSNIDSISTHEMSGNTTDAQMDAPPSYESVAGMNGQLVTPGRPSLMESARSVPSDDSTLNTNTDNDHSFTEPRNNDTTLHHAPMAAQTNFPPSLTSSPPTYESYIAMQHRKT